MSSPLNERPGSLMPNAAKRKNPWMPGLAKKNPNHPEARHDFSLRDFVHRPGKIPLGFFLARSRIEKGQISDDPFLA
jgi:hypothetical protein